MPIFRINNQLIYFAHIPKTGGTSVAEFLELYSDSTAFIFDGQWKQRPRDRWSSTSPQHIGAENLLELFPANFFDHYFAIVRHPEDRIISEYKFRIARSSIHAALPFSVWLRVVLSATKANHYVFDGHLRPQADFVLPDLKVFKLEDGFGNLEKWLATVIGPTESEPSFAFHSNKSKEQAITLTRQDRDLIQEFYRDDFRAFGYETRTADQLSAIGKLSQFGLKLVGFISSAATYLLSWRIPF